MLRLRRSCRGSQAGRDRGESAIEHLPLLNPYGRDTKHPVGLFTGPPS